MYTVQVDDDLSVEDSDERTFQTRVNAIKAAKTLSRNTWRPVQVSDDNDVERLEYRDGELAYYEYDVRRRRRMKRKKK